jgi:hypothetical protein
MRVQLTRICFLAAIWLIIPGGLLAGAPAWLREAAQIAPKIEGAPKEVAILDEQATTVSQGGEVKTLFRRAYRILRPLGDDGQVVAVPINNETQLTLLKAWILFPDAKEYELKERDAIETGAFAEALYADERVKILRIPAPKIGSVIGYEYELRSSPGILQEIWHFQDEIPVCKARFELQLPSSWTFKTYWVNHSAVNPQPGPNNRWSWELESLPATAEEPGMPDRRAIAGWLGISYSPSTAISGFPMLSCWTDIGSWFKQLLANRDQPDGSIRQKVMELTAAAPAPLDKIQALAAFVQKEIRYVAIEIGIGGYQPHSAVDVFRNRYGDCKDKATLLRAMLAAVGVDSYPVLVNSRRGVVNPEFPSALNFDHLILAIPLPSGTSYKGIHAIDQSPKFGTLLYFDPTDPVVPFGLLPESLQASHGLLVGAAGGELRELPLLPASLNKLLRVTEVTLSTSGTTNGAVTEIRCGALASNLRARLLPASMAERSKQVESLLAKVVPGGVLKTAGLGNLDDSSTDLIVRYTFETEGYSKAAGNLLLFQPPALNQQADAFLHGNSDTRRQYPVEFASLFTQSDIVELKIPTGYTVDEVPAQLEINTSFAKYQRKWEVAGALLRCVRKYEIDTIRIPAEQWDEARRFSMAVAADGQNSAVLKKGGELK